MVKKVVWLSSAILIFGLAWYWPVGSKRLACDFYALDVGQGDAILFRTADHQDILIDGGPSAKVLNELGEVLPVGNTELELVVLTHPDADHLTGLVSVIERFSVRQVFVSDIQTDTQTYRAWVAELEKTETPVRVVTQGETFSLGKSTTLEVLWPPKDMHQRYPKIPTNDASTSLRVRCAGSTAVLTGDGSSLLEEGILSRGLNISAALLKIGHHGSRTSSMPEFLQAVNPSKAVISVGKKNRYGHPHPAVLERLKQLAIPIYRTDQMGRVKLQSDGKGGWSSSY